MINAHTIYCNIKRIHEKFVTIVTMVKYMDAYYNRYSKLIIKILMRRLAAIIFDHYYFTAVDIFSDQEKTILLILMNKTDIFIQNIYHNKIKILFYASIKHIFR